MRVTAMEPMAVLDLLDESALATLATEISGRLSRLLDDGGRRLHGLTVTDDHRKAHGQRAEQTGQRACMDFAERLKVPLDHATTLAIVMEAITEVDLSVVTEMDFRADHDRALGHHIGAHTVIGTCVPEMAAAVLADDRASSILFPYNVTIAAIDDACTLVATAEPALIDPIFATDASRPLLASTGERYAALLAAVQRRVDERMAPAVHVATGTRAWPPKLQAIIDEFAEIDDPMERYELLFEYAEELDPLPQEQWTDDTRVQGCQSEAHIIVGEEDGALVIAGAADAQIVQGLIAITVQGLDGLSPEEVLQVPPAFVEATRLNQSLTPSRSNGFLNMYAKVQRAVQAIVDGRAA